MPETDYSETDGRERLKNNIKDLLRRYFESDDEGAPNAEHDPYYTAQDFVDDIHELVGTI